MTQNPHRPSGRTPDEQDAIDRAVISGRMSTDPASPRFPTYWRYVGKSQETGLDLFRHRSTRQYLTASAA